MAKAVSPGLLPAMPSAVRAVADPVEHDIEPRYGYAVALSRRGATQQRCESADRRVRAGADVRDRDGDAGGLLLRSGHGDQARLALHDEVVRVLLGVRPVGA